MIRIVNRLVSLGLAVFVFNVNSVLAYQFDTSFISPVIESPGGEVQSMIVDASNRIVAAGSFSSWDSQTRFNIVRLNANGEVDASFAPSFDGSITKLIESSSGYIAIGSFVRVNSVTTKGIVALNFDGSVDSRFQTNIEGEYRDALRLSNGNILIAGSISVVGDPQPNRSLVQIDSTGALVDSFNFLDNGDSTINAIAEATGGDIVVVGLRIKLGDQEQNGLARLNPDGSIDGDLVSPIPSNVNVFLDEVLVQPDNKVVVAGNFSSFVGASDNRVQRFLSNGELDTDFSLTLEGAVDVLSWFNNKLLIGGQFTTLNGIRRSFYTLALVNIDGTTESDFSPKIDRNRVLVTAQQQSGDMLTAGRATSLVVNSPATSILQRLTSNGMIDESFGVRGLMNVRNSNQAIQNMHVFGTGKILLSGFISRVNGIDVDGLVRFHSNGALDRGFTLDESLTEDPEVSIVGVEGIQSEQIVLDVFRDNDRAYVRLLSNGQLDRTFADDGFLEAERLFGVSDNAFYVAPDRLNRTTILRYGRNGQLDSSFAPVVLNDAFVARAIQLGSNQVMITGRFTTVNGVARPGIAAVDGSGNLLDEFRLSSNSSFNNFQIESFVDGRFIWRSASSITVTDRNAAERSGVSVVTPAAEHDLSYDFSALTNINAVGPQCDNKVWVFGHRTDGSSDGALLRYNANGSLDSSIGAQEPEIENRNFSPRIIRDLSDGRIAISGRQRVATSTGSEFRPALRVIHQTANEQAACYQQDELCVVIPKGAVFCL